MADWQLRTPVVLIIFNRPDTTEKVFRTIAQAKPRKLLVVADGPRFPEEAERCEEARAIIQRVDWDCEILTNFSETNLGCKRRVSSGLDWVFDTVEEAIILEDDCLPHPTFFRFCAELLERYRHDERVMAISGNHFQFGHKRTEYSYYFSRYNHIWGWASWRRAWRHCDIEMRLWPEVRDGGWLQDVLGAPDAARYWTRLFQSTYEGRIDTWDYSWTFACWMQSGLSILPNVNLVSNIGFDATATHTSSKSPFANLPTEAMTFPLRHPPFVICDVRADAFTQSQNFRAPGVAAQARRKLTSLYRRFRSKVAR